MTPAEIRTSARERNRAFLASLNPENAPAPPHRVQTGRAARDLERDLADLAAATAPLLQRGPGGRPRGPAPSLTGGACPCCRAELRMPGRAYCRACNVRKAIQGRRERRERKRRGLPKRKGGRPRGGRNVGRREAA